MSATLDPMTVMDALRSARRGLGDADAPGPPGTAPLPPWAGAALTGALCALASSLVVLVPTVLSWSADARSRSSLSAALGLGSAVWLLTLGAHLTVTPTAVAFVPLGIFLVLLAITASGAVRVLRRRPEDGQRTTAPLPRSAVLALLQWWLGYAVVPAGAALVARLGPVTPVPASLLCPVLVVPALAAGLAVAAQRRYEGELVDPTLARRVLPDAVRRSVVPALRGLGDLVAVGSVVVLVLVGLSFGDIRHVQTALGAGVTGGVVLTLVQLASLPNLALWAVSVLAGPGFQVVDGARTTLSGAHSGLLPLVPVLAALPKPGGFPLPVWGLVLVPVLVGARVGRRALGSVARLSGLATKASVAVTSALLTAGLTGLLDAFSGGHLGTYKLSAVGAPAAPLAAALAVELVVGALAVVAWDAWRLRR